VGQMRKADVPVAIMSPGCRVINSLKYAIRNGE
jgi:hypothetical protein